MTSVPHATPEALAARIAAMGRVREFARRATIFHEGDRSDEVYVVISGHLEVFLSDGEGREIVINEIGPGEIFGEMSLDGNPRSASVIAAEASRVAVVTRAALQALLAKEPDVAFDLLVTVIRRTRNATRVAGNLALMDAYGRLSRLLLDLAHENGGLMVIEDRPTQQQMADRIGATREMVSRILTDMRVNRYVAIEKNRIIIFSGLDGPRR